MPLSAKDKAFLKTREKMVPFSMLLSRLCGVGFVTFLIWLYVKSSLITNPNEVISHLRAGALEESTAYVMACMLPIVFLMSLTLVAILIIFIYIAINNERRYLSILKELRDSTNS